MPLSWLLVPHFARRHHLSIAEARRALMELGPADAEALAAGKVLRSYLDGHKTLDELLPHRMGQKTG
ncbi:hypothetical protein ASC89_04435 [Devosia sp. Root413D1]|uniref:hypothetical protein n=1 Tax=Devosia sp. Root413D1 TaxID=1736531 RepID=UPI0006FCF7D8|nr:hypothetical protein [Devosia sp. Root413D1]KQW81085.1 hypothetical protein ASC89_04435 [Devosia sp. Root413D1]